MLCLRDKVVVLVKAELLILDIEDKVYGLWICDIALVAWLTGAVVEV